MAAGHEVHIVTGQRRAQAEPLVKDIGIHFTHFFSIADHHIAKGTPIKYDEKGNPWMDEKTWNQSKGLYAKEVGLDMMFDDSTEYWKHFGTTGYLWVAKCPPGYMFV